jgi:hypothetical protein
MANMNPLLETGVVRNKAQGITPKQIKYYFGLDLK